MDWKRSEVSVFLAEGNDGEFEAVGDDGEFKVDDIVDKLEPGDVICDLNFKFVGVESKTDGKVKAGGSGKFFEAGGIIDELNAGRDGGVFEDVGVIGKFKVGDTGAESKAGSVGLSVI